MPDVDTHCRISEQRTQGDDFRELHEWIDAPQEHFGVNHRLERHSLNNIYLKYVGDNFGKRGVIEWLFHIAIDNMETANKFAVKVYQKNYEEIRIVFSGKELKLCRFFKKEEDY